MGEILHLEFYNTLSPFNSIRMSLFASMIQTCTQAVLVGAPRPRVSITGCVWRTSPSQATTTVTVSAPAIRGHSATGVRRTNMILNNC